MQQNQIMQNYANCNKMTEAASRLMLIASKTNARKVGNGAAEIFEFPEFITQKACDELIELANRSGYQSKVADPNGDPDFRTSQTTDIHRTTPVCVGIQKHIAALLGMPYENAEDLQAQRYLPGQQFKAHLDTFRPGSKDYIKYCATAGQRTWTAMIYLNDVEEGGQTEFELLGLKQQPIARTMLVWNNLTPEGTINPNTLHHAHPVKKGVKYVATIWFREKPWG